MQITPATLEITTVIGCKVQCKYCPQDLLTRRYMSQSKTSRMSLDTFKTCIDKVPSSIHIGFTGMSEPWLNPACADMMLYAASKGHPLRMFTTLVGMKLEDLERIKDLDFVIFCIHLPDSKGNALIKVDDKYLTLLQKVLEHFADRKHVKQLDMSCHGPLDPRVGEVIPPSLFTPQFLDLLQYKMIDRAGNLDDEELPHQRHEGPLECRLSGRDLNHNILLPNGSVLLCCMDYGQEVVLGNLMEMEYADLFRSRTFIDLQNKLNGNEHVLCRNCSNAIPWQRPYELVDLSSVLNDNTSASARAV